jgi:hypothetical protein
MHLTFLIVGKAVMGSLRVNINAMQGCNIYGSQYISHTCQFQLHYTVHFEITDGIYWSRILYSNITIKI